MYRRNNKLNNTHNTTEKYSVGSFSSSLSKISNAVSAINPDLNKAAGACTQHSLNEMDRQAMKLIGIENPDEIEINKKCWCDSGAVNS